MLPFSLSVFLYFLHYTLFYLSQSSLWFCSSVYIGFFFFFYFGLDIIPPYELLLDIYFVAIVQMPSRFSVEILLPQSFFRLAILNTSVLSCLATIYLRFLPTLLMTIFWSVLQGPFGRALASIIFCGLSLLVYIWSGSCSPYYLTCISIEISAGPICFRRFTHGEMDILRNTDISYLSYVFNETTNHYKNYEPNQPNTISIMKSCN